jgi:hypothetical protein
LDILVHNSNLQFFLYQRFLLRCRPTQIVLSLEWRRIGFYGLCVHEPASLTRNYGTRILPSQLDAWLWPTSESLALTGGLVGCWPSYPPILCDPSKTRNVCVNSTATSHPGLSSYWLLLNLAGVRRHIRASTLHGKVRKPCCIAGLKALRLVHFFRGSLKELTNAI